MKRKTKRPAIFDYLLLVGHRSSRFPPWWKKSISNKASNVLIFIFFRGFFSYFLVFLVISPLLLLLLLLGSIYGYIGGPDDTLLI
jgi:hypothetical protein